MLVVYGTIQSNPEEGDLSFFKVKQVNGVWSIEGKTPEKKQVNFTFGPTDILTSPNIAILKLNKKDQPFLTWVNELYNDKVGDTFNSTKNNASLDAKAIASFFIEESNIIHCTMYSDRVIIENENESEVIVEQERNIFMFDAGDRYPFNFSNIFKKIRAKLKLLDNLSVTGSVAALESQVDLLSLMVVQLAQLIPEENRPAWLPQLATIVNDYGVQHTHSIEKMLNDISENKRLLTELRNTYINERE